MKAAIYTRFGPPEVFEITEIDKPVPKDNEVLVKVHASTVSASVINLRKGVHPFSKAFSIMLRLFYGPFKPKRPILGHEFSGEIESIGKDVTLFKVGDQVFGTTTGLKDGAYAEYMSVPEKWKDGIIAHKPINMTHAEAAAVPIGGTTALHFLREGYIRPEIKVLIYGASGSVGTYAIQLAKHSQAHVTGVCGPTNQELVKSLGADQIIDYTKEDFSERGDQYDLVFDAVGKASPTNCQKVLNPKGIFVTVAKGYAEEFTDDLLFLKSLIEEGTLKAVIDRQYPLEKIIEANRYVDKGHKKGNVVITIKEDSEGME